MHLFSPLRPQSNESIRRLLSLAVTCSVLLAFACAGGDAEEDQVTWPELVAFDEIAYRVDGYARTGDFGLVEEAKAELLEAGQAVTAATIPPNAADAKQVRTTLTDLESLVEGLSTASDRETLEPLVLGFHPVIESLMKAAGMPHVHANEGEKGGFLFPVFDAEGEQVGTCEIKLHDDAGDIEVWLSRGGYDGEPWRLPVSTSLSLRFADLDKDVTLSVRDEERNEDESGAVTVVAGATDYFVFPGETGVDAAWLMGKEFAAKAELVVGDSTTGVFVLRPHVH
ncbi:MAG: hypothetical protein AAF726_09975 [Planctomycetota bacterium]